MSRSVYADAIEIIQAIKTSDDAMRIIYEMAKTAPGALVKAARSTAAISKSENTMRTISRDALAQMASQCANGKKIEAIKTLREVTGWSLVEAKDWIDVLFEKVRRE